MREENIIVSYNEFHISKEVRDLCKFDEQLFSSSGNVVFANLTAVQKFQMKLNALFEERGEENRKVSAGTLNAMGLIDEIFHFVCMLYRRNKAPDAFKNLCEDLDVYFKKEEMDKLYLEFMAEFPPTEVYKGNLSAEEYLSQNCLDLGTNLERSNREQVLEEMILLHLANENPAFHPFQILFDDRKLVENPAYVKTWNQIKAFFKTQPVFGPKDNDLITMLKEPVNACPTSLKGQLDYIRTHWTGFIGEWLSRLLSGMDTISEEEKAAWHPTNGGSPDMAPPDYDSLINEYERFSPDRDWMPKVVLMAKTVLVWLYQLSKKYNRPINRLDQIPDEELNALHDQGFTGLWLIGLWQRSNASKRIKQINGNPEAAASAYSLLDYEIADNLGGWDALDNLRRRCWARGIRLASDMVPNHTGMDGNWVVEHPNLFVTTKENPFPQYTYNGENLSHDSRVAIYLEDHYYSKSDCAVCFKRVDTYTGDTTYIYHGNDGTGMPWNDTAQIDFLNPEAREAVMQQILKVARNFPIIRFDAAMVLAKKHIRRLWYPEPGHGGDIATRSRYALTNEQFEERIPNEFWREVVDRCAQEMPDTLLLAEAFWMMEGYFTRTLGMHRVYNSAFMNMLKKEENQKYRDTVKNTIKFDPQILKRFVNFMNNPDEETAVAQFGRGDKYFGVCTLMITMPGLPMFGHGQLEGYEEKYGMEYTRAYKDENVDQGLLDRHWHDIFPILHKRYLFAGVENFLFYDVWNNGSVNENIFAYSNSTGTESTIVFYNNKYDQACGWIKQSCEYAVKTGSGEDDIRMESRSLSQGIGLQGGYNKYCIFREHKSGLWFIRKSDEIINNGMFVALKGFEYQVYLDVQEVADTADGKYSKLCELLNGSGVQDIDVAWQEYCYKDLYAELAKFVDQDFFKKLDALFASDKELKEKELKKISVKQFCKDLEEKAMAYYEKELEFATLAAEEEERKAEEEAKALAEQAEASEKSSKTKTAKAPKAKKTVTPKEARINSKAAFATAEKRYDAFCKQMEYLVKIKADVSELAAKEQKEGTFEYTVAQGFQQNPDAHVTLALFAAISSAGSSNCQKWGYSRKMAELARHAEVEVKDITDVLSRLFLLMKIRDYGFGTAGFAKAVYDAACLIAQGKNAWNLCGANEYNGVVWFNKERMESTLWYGIAGVSMYSPRTSREQIVKLFRALTAAKENAEYQCGRFILSLEPPKAQKKTAKKSKAEAEDGKSGEAEGETKPKAKRTSRKAEKKPE